jgi:hypothetical protein
MRLAVVQVLVGIRELLIASSSRLFTHGDSAFCLFVWDRSGHVVGHIYRAYWVEVKYKNSSRGWRERIHGQTPFCD